MEHDEKHLQPNLVGIGSWGPEIWLHEYLISPTETSVNWPESKQLWTRPIYTHFNGANEVFMRPYLGPPWTNSCLIWCMRVFHHILLKYGHESAEMQKKKKKKKKKDDVTRQYSIATDFTIHNTSIHPHFSAMAVYVLLCITSDNLKCIVSINSRVDRDVLMEVAYSCNFLAVSDSSTCPDIGTSWCHAGIIEHFEIRGFKMTP